MMATGKPVPDVAKEHGYSKHTFYRVINGERCIDDVRSIISSITKKSVSDLWPDQHEEKSS
jgi:DNA-binding LacI/PurR family transcriptional regulator